MSQLIDLTRGVVDLHMRAELETRIVESKDTGRPLRIKAGFDPTRPDLHLGHTVLMQKLKQFQELGHTVIFLIGDYTAMVGDPTGRNKMRPPLSHDEVKRAAETYVAQAFKILDSKHTEIRYNSEWLSAMNMLQLVQLMATSTVSRMLERNDFAQRFSSHKPIYQHEFLYPLLQAYDSVVLDADVELGGSDQLFNLLVGRDLMPIYHKRAQIVMTTPLLEGIFAKVDEQGHIVGEKMSKSADNYIGIDEPAYEQFRKVMLIDDRVIWRYFELLSAKSSVEIQQLQQDVQAGQNPKEIKKIFAHEIAARFHTESAAMQARRDWESKFEGKVDAEEIPLVTVYSDFNQLWLPKAIVEAKLTESTSRAKQLVEQGGVEVDHVRITNSQHKLACGQVYLIRVGSKQRKFARIVVQQRTS